MPGDHYIIVMLAERDTAGYNYSHDPVGYKIPLTRTLQTFLGLFFVLHVDYLVEIFVAAFDVAVAEVEVAAIGEVRMMVFVAGAAAVVE